MNSLPENSAKATFAESEGSGVKAKKQTQFVLSKKPSSRAVAPLPQKLSLFRSCACGARIKNYEDFWDILMTKEEKIMEKFAERLKELRIEKDLSIQALAKEVYIGSSSICRWENCQADVKGSQLIILAKYFNVSIDYLMGLED